MRVRMPPMRAKATDPPVGTRGRRAAADVAFVAAVLLGTLLFPGPSPAAAATELPSLTITASTATAEQEPPDISAPAAILIEAGQGTVLFSKNPDERLPMASTTKIMTAILVLEALDLDDEVVVPRSATATPGSLASLVWGEVLTVEELLYALLLPSGNDAALVLAQKTAGTVQAFVAKMNEKAEEMGLINTHFSNPNGLHLEDHFSSTRDLATLAQYAMRDPAFRRIVDTPTYELPWPGEDEGVREWKSGNELLSEYPWVTGVKTGSTPYAKYCMVASGSLDGVSLIAVLLGAADNDTRWKESMALLEYGQDLYPSTVLVDRGQIVAELDVSDPLGRKVRLVSERALTRRLCATEVVSGHPRLLDEITLPVHVGDELGILDFTIDGTFLDSVKLIAANSIVKPKIGELLQYWRYALRPAFARPE